MRLIKREASLPHALETFLGDGFLNDLFVPAGRLLSGLDLSVPRINVIEDAKSFCVTADLPGVSKENVDVSINDGILTIRAHSESETKEEKEGQVIRHERYAGKYLRCLPLGTNVAVKDVQAKLKDGVLTLKIPKLEASATSSVKIAVQ